jgi:hypothetical protein
MSRSREPEGTPTVKRDPKAELAWSIETQVKAARTWLGNVDMLARQNRLSHAASAVIDAAESVVKLGASDSFWLVTRAIQTLAENGYTIDERFHGSWLAKLRAHVEPVAVKGSPESDFEWRT